MGIESLITVVIYIIVIGIVLYALQYAVDHLPMFEPFRSTAKVILVVIGLLILALAILRLTGVSMRF